MQDQAVPAAKTSPIADRIRAYVEERKATTKRYSARTLSAEALGNPTQLSTVLATLDAGGQVGHGLLVSLAGTMGKSVAWLLGEEESVLETLRAVDVDRMTPLEALALVAKLKKMAER